MKETSSYKNFADFYPFYLSQHSHRGTKIFHVIGTSGLFVMLGVALVQWEPEWILNGVVFAYGMAWLSHMVFEKTRPATFRNPFFSLCGDFKMYFELVTGKIKF